MKFVEKFAIDNLKFVSSVIYGLPIDQTENHVANKSQLSYVIPGFLPVGESVSAQANAAAFQDIRKMEIYASGISQHKFKNHR